MQALNGAIKVSWVFTMMCIVLIMETINKDSSAFPAKFYLLLTLFVMLIVFSVTFLFLFRTEKEEEIEEGEGK